MTILVKYMMIESSSLGRKINLFGAQVPTEHGLSMIKAESLEALAECVKYWTNGEYEVER